MNTKPDIQIYPSNPGDKDTLHFTKDGVWVGLLVYNFTDKDTKQFICYCPALELSGYGETENLANDMMKISINDYLQYLGTLSIKQRDKELVSLGWKKDRLKNKDFSKAYVDVSGELKNFNADEGSVKRSTLKTAA